MAEILCFHKGGREARKALVREGKAPSDFFYGLLELERQGYNIREIDTTRPYSGLSGRFSRAIELALSQYMKLGIRRRFAREIAPDLAAARVALSFTDGFSLSLGLLNVRDSGPRPFSIGVFHGLSDLHSRAMPGARHLSRAVIRRALAGLDHVSLMGAADREFALKFYGLEPERVSLFDFGVDTGFWHPASEGSVPEVPNWIVSVGSDTKRDYETLTQVQTSVPIRILTRLKVALPPGGNITRIDGSYWEGGISDQDVRAMYHKAMAVVVPLKDVFQPTGTSVSLQAMACGKPVILSRIKGLWAPSLLRDGENCLLVPPGDPVAIENAIQRLSRDKELREQIGWKARQLVETHFSALASVMTTTRLIELGLSNTRTG